MVHHDNERLTQQKQGCSMFREVETLTEEASKLSSGSRAFCSGLLFCSSITNESPAKSCH